VNPFFFPRLGGIERRIYHLGRELAARGHRVTVLTGGAQGREPERERMDGLEVVRVPTRALPIKWDPPVERARGVTDRPLYAGFGISTPEQARAAAELADGVVVGSAALDAAGAGPSALREFVASLRRAL